MARQRLQRVLVLNADTLSHETITLALTRATFDVVMETDVALALRIVRRSTRPIVIVVDFSLTRWRESGEFLKMIAADANLAQRHAYILLLSTTETIPLDVGQSLTTLAPTILAKPLTTSMVFAAVGTAAARINPTQHTTP